LRTVTENFESLSAALARRGFNDAKLLERLQQLATQRRDAIVRAEDSKQKRNQASEQMAQIKDKASDDFKLRRESLRVLSDQIKALDDEQKKIESELEELLATI